MGKESCSKEIPRAGKTDVSKLLASKAWGPELDPQKNKMAEGEKRLPKVLLCPLPVCCGTCAYTYI